jgi:hypothetical protein
LHERRTVPSKRTGKNRNFIILILRKYEYFIAAASKK